MRLADFDWVRELLLQHAAIVIEPRKMYLVEARLPPVARRNDFASVEARIGRRKDLRRAIVDALTTNETSFFRDRAIWEALRESLLPDLIQRRASRKTLRIGSAACSTGQEPYTLAMLLLEDFPELADWHVKILATDVSRSVLDKAREGAFGAYELDRGLPPTLRRRHFERLPGGRSQISAACRDMVCFQQLNLAGPWPALPTFDVIFVRNVLIYFDAPTTQK